MNIFKKIGKSVYGPEFYSSLKLEKTSASVKYYLKFVLLISIIPALVWSSTLIPSLFNLLSAENVAKTVALYPAELVLTIKDGQFSTNVTEPYYIPLPEKFKGDTSDSNKRVVDNFVVIDTKIENFTPDILEQYKTSVLITKNSVISEKDGGLQVMPLNKTMIYELNSQVIQGLASKTIPILKALIYFIPIFVYVICFISYIWSLIPLFLTALLVWLALTIKKVNSGYMHAYRVSIHAVTLGVLLNVVYSILFGGSLGWYIMAIVTIIMALVNVKKVTIAEAVPAPETPVPVV